MAQHGTAKAGHGGNAGGGSDGGAAGDDPAAEAGARALPSGPAGPARIARSHGQSEAEEQLYAYLELMTNSKPASGFPPLDELNARLNEEPYRDSLLFPRTGDGFEFGPSQDDPWPELSSVPLDEPQRGLDWFDHRFTEIKQLLAKKDESTREIEQIKASLGEILVRLEKISTDMPSGSTLASVETKLATVSGSLEAAREQSAADAGRISRAAEEILAASARIREVPAKFETAARHTLDGLGQTVAATASRAAVMAAHHVSPAEPGRRAKPGRPLGGGVAHAQSAIARVRRAHGRRARSRQ